MSDTARVRWTVYGSSAEPGDYKLSMRAVPDDWEPRGEVTVDWLVDPGMPPALYVAAWTAEDASRKYKRTWAEIEADGRAQHRHP